MRVNESPSSSARIPDWSARAASTRSRRSLLASLVAVPALVALTACAGAAPTPPTQPTVQAAATQVVGAASPAVATMQAVASPAVATVQAVASPVVATAQAAVSPAATAGAGVVATAAAGLAPMASPSPAAAIPGGQGLGALRIADASLADATPWVSIQNTSEEAIPVGGWKLQVGEATAELPPGAVVQPGAALTLHAGTGLSSDDELFLGNAGDVLVAAALPGTPVRLTDADGRVHAQTTVPRF